MMFVEKNIFNYLFMTQITANCNVSISLFIYDQDKSNVLIQLIHDFFRQTHRKLYITLEQDWHLDWEQFIVLYKRGCHGNSKVITLGTDI